MAVTPGDPPQGSRLLQLIWAWMHKPTFYPLIALLVTGPPLTAIAWQTPGKHRTALVLAWLLFLAVLISCFGKRTAVMLRILWEQMT